MLAEKKLAKQEAIDALVRECDELIAITVSSIKTARARQ